MASGRLVDYLGSDVIANRDPAPNLHPNTLGLFYATDTNAFSVWNGAAWVSPLGSGVVVTVGGGSGIDVDDTDPENPVVNLGATTLASLLLADSSVQSISAGAGVDVDNTDPLNPIISATGGGSGDVVGPASSVDSHIALFDGTTGKLLKDGGKTIADLRTPAIQSVTSATTVTPSFGDDLVKITAQATALTLANPSGTPIPGLGLVIRIKDNGTARAITYGTQYRAIGVTLPTTTVISKTLYLAMIWNSDDTTFDVVAVGQQA